MGIYFTHPELVEMHGGPARSSLLGRDRTINAITMRLDVDIAVDVAPGEPRVYRINSLDTPRDYPRAERMGREQKGDLIYLYIKRGTGQYEEIGQVVVGESLVRGNELEIQLLDPTPENMGGTGLIDF